VQHQKKLDYTHSLDSLFVLSEEIGFIAVINIFGEVVKQYNKNLAINPISREEISNQLHILLVNPGASIVQILLKSERRMQVSRCLRTCMHR
jgi:hypothetical protein